MRLSDAASTALENYRSEWDKAERSIKLAEQVNAEIVNPAIYELRYGGRRLVEALGKTDEVETIQLLKDAHFDCMRARHDAIDAATSKMVADLDIATKRLGVTSVLAAYPALPNLVADLGAVRDLIAESRGNRDNRDAIYASIESDNLGDLVKRFRAFQANENIMLAHAKGERRDKLFLTITTVISLLVAVATLIWCNA